MSTARDIITSALKIIRVLAAGETPTAEELSDGLSKLNDMIDSFSNESLMIHSITKEEFTCTANQQVHTLGDTGDFDTLRPIKINKVLFQDSSGLELPINIRQMEEYADVSSKEVTSEIPTDVYIDPSYPLMNLYLYPIPSTASNVVVYSEKNIQSFTNASTQVSLPPGYKTLLIYNLAMYLAPEYGKTLSAEAMNVAIESKASIKRTNKKPRFLTTDAVGSLPSMPWDWRSGN